tara:strand:- start:17009 stop:17884 length:876 start_codon:yes stop_codon:yes gene_type:complete
METETLPFLHKDRPRKDFSLIRDVCDYILSHRFKNPKRDDSVCGVFIDGRKRHINTLEDFAAILSFKSFSAYNFPVFCFIHDDTNFLGGMSKDQLEMLRIEIIKIPEITSLEEYTKFCIQDLYIRIPEHIEYVLTLQPDGMLIKDGWEEFAIGNQFDWVSPHWQHQAGVGVISPSDDLEKLVVSPPYSNVNIGNGGFSFRKREKMVQICKAFNFLRCCELGRDDFRIPMEDLFFTYFGFGSGIITPPTLRQCDEFAVDPMTRELFDSGKDNWPFGFHCFNHEADFKHIDHA